MQRLLEWVMFNAHAMLIFIVLLRESSQNT